MQNADQKLKQTYIRYKNANLHEIQKRLRREISSNIIVFTIYYWGN